MTAWIRNGSRLDIELAVALEIASLHLSRAANLVEKEAAIGFNARLWRTIGQLAADAPAAEDRQGLMASAQQIDSERDIARLVACNGEHARKLAGRAATQGALRHLLGEWTVHRRAKGAINFSGWLVDRIEDFVLPQPLAA